MKKFKFTIRGNTYDVEVIDFENNIVELEVNGTHYQVEIHRTVKQSKTPRLIRSQVAVPKEASKIQPKTDAHLVKISAPLPGTILKINVKEGDTVKKGDILLTMEAMKMENSVLAEKAGTIKQVNVAAGDNVLQNDVLIEIM